MGACKRESSNQTKNRSQPTTTRSQRREISQQLPYLSQQLPDLSEQLYQIRRRTDLTQELFLCINIRSQPRTTNTTTNQKNRLPGRSVTTARGRRREISNARERRRESSHAGERRRESLLGVMGSSRGRGDVRGRDGRGEEAAAKPEREASASARRARGEREREESASGRAQPGSRGTRLLAVSHGPG